MLFTYRHLFTCLLCYFIDLKTHEYLHVPGFLPYLLIDIFLLAWCAAVLCCVPALGLGRGGEGFGGVRERGVNWCGVLLKISIIIPTKQTLTFTLWMYLVSHLIWHNILFHSISVIEKNWIEQQKQIQNVSTKINMQIWKHLQNNLTTSIFSRLL